MLRSLALLALSLLSACGDSPIERRLGAARIVRTVGPGGGLLRGAGGSELEGFELNIPPGALDRLVEIVVEPGSDIPLAGSTAVSRSFALRVTPDPGVLRLPAHLRVSIDLPLAGRPQDLVVATRLPADRPAIRSTTVDRPGVASDFGEYDPLTKDFTTGVRTLRDLQLRRATRPRLVDDAIRLTQLGYDRLSALTDAGLLEADLLFGEAQRADPFAGFPNLLRAVSRIMLALNDRSDVGPGLDSVGEALQRCGFDVTSQSLVERTRSGSWPAFIDVPVGAPSALEVLELLGQTLRPAIELALADLDRVPPTTGIIITLPPIVTALPGEREVDAADVLVLRGLLDGAAFLMLHLADFDLDADPRRIAPRSGPQPTLEALLAWFPTFGRRLRGPDQPTIDALRATLLHAREAFDAIDAEDDEQHDDFVVFPSNFDAAARDRLSQNLTAIQSSLEDDVESRIALGASAGSIAIRIGGPWRAGSVSPRDGLPHFDRFVPLAGTLPDPTLGGLLPGMTQQRAADLLGFADRHELPRLPIVADGRFDDWTPAAEALDPADPLGDVDERDVDLWRVWAAQSDDELAFRIGLAAGSVGFSEERATVYGIVMRPVNDTSYGESTTIELHPTREGFDLRVSHRGVTRDLRGRAAARGSDVELTVDRFDVFDPDEPVADRAIHAFAESLDLASARRARDRTRPFLSRL